MGADITRNTFDPFKHFTRVLMQQGRVQLDADWNEQAAILLNYLQTLAADLIGPHGGPAANLGFRISDSTMATDLAISSGHYYVDGILCELASPSAPVPVTSIAGQPKEFQIPVSSVASFSPTQNQPKPPVLLSAEKRQSVLTTIQSVQKDVVTVQEGKAVSDVLTATTQIAAYPDVTTYLTQPDYPKPPTLSSGLIYLDVWERLVTYVEDDSIREVALNGADTAARSKLVCQVKLWPGGTAPAPDSTSDLKGHFQPANRGSLKAQAKQTSASTDPCVIAPDASYSGPENQLYRVEIHNRGRYKQSNPISTDGPTFKWSRENGSVIFPIVSLSSGSQATTVVLENLGRDDRFGLKPNDWVEIQDDDYVLQNRHEPLMQVQSIDSGSLTVTLTGSTTTGQGPSKHPLLRRWDQTAGDPAQGGLQLGSDNAALILEGSNDTNWLNLEDGIQIQFQPAEPPNTYRTGDYWLIPARTATGDIEWPTGTAGPLPLPPDGVDHHYAPLAVIIVTPENGVTVDYPCQQQFELTLQRAMP